MDNCEDGPNKPYPFVSHFDGQSIHAFRADMPLSVVMGKLAAYSCSAECLGYPHALFRAHRDIRIMKDGTCSIFSNGVPSFSSLAVREQQIQRTRIDYLSKNLPASYIVFDILYLDQESLMDRPLVDRKSILKAELQESDVVTIIDYLPEDGEAYFEAALRIGLEGIIAKRLASSYQPGVRSRDQIKIKKRLTLDLVVGGYIPGLGQREPFFGALLLGAYDSGKLFFTGKVGSGFSMQELEEISGEFIPSDESPFFHPISVRDVRWLKPELVVEVETLEVSKRRHLRAPVFLRKRTDKLPEECTMDQLQTT